MGRIKTLDGREGGINKWFQPKYLALADIEKNVRIFSQKCQENIRILKINFFVDTLIVEARKLVQNVWYEFTTQLLLCGE